MSARAYYPLFVDLNGRRCVVVGGGMVAQRKAAALLRFGAKVTVVSPTLTRPLAVYARQQKIRHVARRFRPSDVRDAWLIYAATDDQRINERVYRAASQRRIFTNVVDQKPLCSCIAPAIVKRGALVIAISTGGASPTIAKQVRRTVEQTIGSDYARMARLLRSLRAVAKRRLPSSRDRQRYFNRLVRGSVFALVRAGRMRAARQRALAWLERAAANNGS